MLDCCVCVHLSLQPVNEAVTVVNGQAVCLIHMGHVPNSPDFIKLIDSVLGNRDASQ